MAKRQGRKSAAQTPAPRKERIYGSKKNPKGSASSEKTASKIQLSQDILKGLEKKLKEFKEKNPSKKNVTLADLKAVFRRGAGAYSKSHRPFITGGVPNSRNAWAYARVNKFLKKAAGQKVKAAYVQDDDLLKREDGGEVFAKGGLIAPNGKKSNLTPEQYKLVRTPQFKEWFGDWENDPENASKVVDENGEPLIVWHSSTKFFNTFEKREGGDYGFHFGTITSAIDRLSFHIDEIGFPLYEFCNEKLRQYIQENENFFIDKYSMWGLCTKYILMSYYLPESKLKKYIQQTINNSSRPDDAYLYFKTIVKPNLILNKDKISKYTFNTRPYFLNVKKLGKTKDQNDIGENWKYIDSVNYEGYSYINKVEGIGDISFIVFNSNQIKLADGTNKTFDGSNSDIRYAEGGQTFNDKELLAKWKRGESIGFTAVAHLKAKGLIPRADGTKRKSAKYLSEGGETRIPFDYGFIGSHTFRFKYLREAEDEEVENFFDSNWQEIARWSEGKGRGTTPHAIYTNGSQYLLEREDYGFDGYNSPQYYFVSINDSFAKGGEVKVVYDSSNIDSDSLDEIFEDTGYRPYDSLGQPHIFLIEENKIIGCLFLNDKIYFDERSNYEFDIVIKANKRGKGYAKLLLDEMINDFVSNFKKSKEIQANVVNDELSKYLITKYGFKCIGRGYNLRIENLCLLSRKKAIEYLKNNKDTDKKFAKGGEIDPKVLRERWAKKKDALQNLANNIQRLRTNLSKDLKEGDEKEKLTALVVKVMDETGERVGNDVSADNGHFGVTGLKKKHIKVNGSNLKFKYTGKSGVEHEKEINDSTLANAMREAIKNSPSEYVFETSDGFRIKNDRVNRYLNRFDVSAKDLRGYSANKWIITRLKSVKDREILGDAKKRKTKFNEIVKDVAEKVGHGRATLKKHYLLPSLEREFINHGKIVDLSNIKRTYEDGGEIVSHINDDDMDFAKRGKLLDNYAFADSKLGLLGNYFKKIQSAKTFEKNNILENNLIRLIADWVEDTNDKNANQIYIRKQIIKKLIKQYPKIFQAPKNKIVYRGIAFYRDDEKFYRGQTIDKYLELFLRDFSFDDVVKIKGNNQENFYFIKRPISYTEKRNVQSWTTNFKSALNFGEEGIIMVKKTNDEFFMNPEVLNVMTGSNENEVIHIGKEIDDAYILISDFALEKLDQKIVDIQSKKAKSINEVSKQFAEGGETKEMIALPDTYSQYERLKEILRNQGYDLTKKGMARGGDTHDEVNTGFDALANLETEPLNELADVPNDGLGIYDKGGKTQYRDGVSKLVNKESVEHLIPTFEEDDINWFKLIHSKDLINQLLENIGIPIKVKFELGEGANGTAWMTENDTVLKLTKNGAEAYSSYIIFKNQENFRSQAEIYNIFIINDYSKVDVQRIYFIEKQFLNPFQDSKASSISHIYNDIEATATATKYSNNDRLEMLENIIRDENLSEQESIYARQVFALAKDVDKEARAYGINLRDNHSGNVGFDNNGKLLCYDCAYLGNKKLNKGGNLKNEKMENLKVGGEISQEEKKEIYAKWKKLVNMSKSELQKFYDSEEGKQAGLTPEEAKEAGIDSGRESARWIMKMKDTKVADWTPTMWMWAKKQISFVSRMSGNKGKLVDENGKKTRKYLSLLIWGNDPNKKAGGGDIDEPCHVCSMNDAQYQNLPALGEMADGKRFVYRESVFAKGGDTMSHVGDRYLILECMGEGGITDTLNLKVIQSSSPALLVGSVINRPIRNIINKGREMGTTFGQNIVGSYKKGGELNPDNKAVKNYFEHKSGSAGGLLVGKRHSEGGIKAINNSTGQPLEMEGGEVVITRDAVSDPTPVNYEGKQMTKREVLSEINQSGGGVAFANGGVVGEKTA